MPKRQLRYLANTIAINIPILLGKMANIIMQNNKVYCGTITKIDDTKIQLRNTSYGFMTISINEVEEIIIDVESKY